MANNVNSVIKRAIVQVLNLHLVMWIGRKNAASL